MPHALESIIPTSPILAVPGSTALARKAAGSLPFALITILAATAAHADPMWVSPNPGAQEGSPRPTLPPLGTTPPGSGSESGAEAGPSGGLPRMVGKGPRQGDHLIIRSNESYPRRLKASAGDIFAPLKHLDLTTDGSIYVTLSGEERIRILNQTIPSRDGSAKATQFNVQFRHAYGADLHLGNHVRAYAQLQSSNVTGRNYVTPGIARQRDVLDLMSGFVEVRGNVAGGNAAIEIGRQILELGSGAIISPQPIQNVQRNFDGVHASFQRKLARIDLIALRPLTYKPGVFDDHTDNAISIWGIYGTLGLPRTTGAALNIDPFFFHYKNEKSEYLPTVSVDERDVYGARLWGRVGNIRIDVNGAYQSGRLGNKPVSAWGLYSVARIALSRGNIRPTLSFMLDINSGGSREGETIRTYNPLFTKQRYTIIGNRLGFLNFYAPGAAVSIAPANGLTLSLGARGFWKYSVQDGYAPAYATVRTYTRSRARYVGLLPQAGMRWRLNHNTYFVISQNILLPGGGFSPLSNRPIVTTQSVLSFMF